MSIVMESFSLIWSLPKLENTVKLISPHCDKSTFALKVKVSISIEFSEANISVVIGPLFIL